MKTLCHYKKLIIATLAATLIGCGGGGSTKGGDTHEQTLEPVNTPPKITLNGPTAIIGEKNVTISAIVTDNETVKSINWAQLKGPELQMSIQDSTVLFQAPHTPEPYTIELEITAEDNQSLVSKESISIEVTPRSTKFDKLDFTISLIDKNPSIIYGWKRPELIGEDTKLMRSKDAGNSWSPIYTLKNSAPNRIHPTLSSSKHVAGHLRITLRNNDDNSDTYLDSFNYGDTFETYTDDSVEAVFNTEYFFGKEPTTIWSLNHKNKTLKVSNDLGKTFSVISYNEHISYHSNLILPKNAENIIYLVNSSSLTNQVFQVSLDNGHTFEDRSVGLPTNISTKIIVNPKNHQHILYDHYDGFYETTDSGLTWKHSNIGSNYRVYEDTEGNLYRRDEDKFEVSLDFGESWQYLYAMPKNVHDIFIFSVNKGFFYFDIEGEGTFKGYKEQI